MKYCQLNTFGRATVGLVLAGLSPLVVAQAAPLKKSPVKSAVAKVAPQVIAKSVFVMPTTPGEGRDPFFPDSTRVYSEFHPKVKPAPREVTLILNGLSGTPDHRLAMINGRTMAEGEEADIAGATGHFHVRCLSIQGDSVIVEVDGQRRELRMRTN